MRRFILSAAAILAAASFGLSAAHANELEDVENARGNARAGGPTNGYDAYLLARYGRLSGTRDSANRDWYGDRDGYVVRRDYNDRGHEKRARD